MRIIERHEIIKIGAFGIAVPVFVRYQLLMMMTTIISYIHYAFHTSKFSHSYNKVRNNS